MTTTLQRRTGFRALIRALAGVCLLAACTAVCNGTVYLVTITADALAFQPVTNNLGSISFINEGDGSGYRFTAKKNDGKFASGRFSLANGAAFRDTTKSVNVTVPIYYGEIGQQLTQARLTIQRDLGVAFGNYSVTDTPLGTVSSVFSLVRFSGLVQITNATSFGQLQGLDNAIGTPQTMIMGPERGDDAVGEQTGLELGIITGGDNTVTLVDNRDQARNARLPWRWFIGKYATVETSGLSLRIERSDGAGKPWTPLFSVPLSTVDNKQIYRLVIRQQ